MIFEEFERTNSEHYKRNQTAYEFLNCSSWNICKFSRFKINEIVTSYPIDAEFIRVFKSKSNKQHLSALFELLVYYSLTNLKLIVEKHPITKNGKRPDFKIKSGNKDIYLECTLSGGTFDNEDEKKRKDVIEDIVDSIEYFPYWINLEFIATSKKNISKRKFLYFVDNIKKNCDSYTDNELKNIYFEFSDNDWKLKISLFRKSNPEIRRSLGIINHGFKIIDKTRSIMTAINDKRASKYQIEDEPYIICLCNDDFSISDNDIAEVLLGQPYSEKFNICQSKNSFWIANSKPINTSISAVIFFKNFSLFTLENSQVELWHNPFAKNKLEKDTFNFKQYYFDIVEENIFTVEKISGIDIWNLLNVDKESYTKMNKKESSE